MAEVPRVNDLRTRTAPERVVWWSDGRRRVPRARKMEAVLDTPERAISLKPSGGVWTSPEGSRFSWEDWCRREGLERWLHTKYVLTVNGAHEVLLVDGWDDLVAVHARYPGGSIDLGAFREWRHPTLSFEAMAKDYAGIWLTAHGHFETRVPSFHSKAPPEWVSSLGTNGWDCETILWFRWAFSKVEVAA